MKITEKLKDVLKEEDLKELETGIKTMISEQVALKVEEKTIELEKKAEEFCEQEISEKVEAEKEALIEEYEGKMEDLETNMVEKLDRFLDSVITEQISDESIKAIALNETYEPIIKGIQAIFEEKYVALDVEGEQLVKEANAKVDQLKEENSSLLKENMEMSELAEAGAVKLLIAEKTDGLTDTQKDRVQTFCENKSFDEVENQIDSFIEIVEEKEEDEDSLDESVDSNLSDADNVDAKEVIKEEEELEKKKLDESKEEEKKTDPFVNSANKFL